MSAIVEIDAKHIDEESNSICAIAQSLQIQSNEDLGAATECIQEIKGMKAEIDATFDPHIKTAHEQHKALLATKAKFFAPLDSAERLLKQRTGLFLQEQEAARQAEQRRLDDLARAEEKARRDAEMAAIKAQAEAAAKSAPKAEAKAIIAEAKQEVQAIAAAPIMVAAPVVEIAPKPAGVTATLVYKYRIIHVDMLPREYLVPNEKMIAGIVKAMRGETRIPGVEIFTEQQIAVRRKG
jgi:hypothetical protein